MNMREIEIICELPNYDNFSDAAYGLSCSASVITKYVSNVENELGLPLFIRSHKSSKLQLTSAGTEIIKAMRRIRNDYHYMLEFSRQSQAGGKCRLRIGTQPRFGNYHEAKIISTFLLENPDVEVHMSKSLLKELSHMLSSGKIDVIFATLHELTHAEDYFEQILPQPDLEITRLVTESNMYCGIADHYFPGQSEVMLKQLRDFVFALPFPNSGDIQETNAIQSWRQHAQKGNFELKSISFNALDDTIFQLAAMKPIAVCTTSLPQKRAGIKFVRISDWEGCSNLYLICRAGAQNCLLSRLRHIALAYRDSMERETASDPSSSEQPASAIYGHPLP